ncbi:MAG: ABC transporter substrate-binding protein [Acidobacteria bacterium]|nr:ABC transporter substrate-binding protein [Acidobacteriota bacterium]MYA46692.1 ABC transporter substrate-binding protein [Acidobacteriota bacterium]MYI39225.1 ABC transporter substrate-binding protein [Acidobacteriota bacterium]
MRGSGRGLRERGYFRPSRHRNERNQPVTPAPILRVGHSPDPDDAFMFCALAKGAVRIRDYQVEHVLEDIESLNDRALAGELPITAISAHAYLSVADRYWIMATGASMGEGYGPVVVSRKAGSLEDLAGRRVAIPGPRTTAALLARCYIGEFEPVVVPFDQIFETVEAGRAEAGVVIHEGQLTYEARGFHLLSDFGVRFEDEHGLPLPLGLDVVRRDLGRDLAIEVNRAMRASIDWAYANEDEALDYALLFGRGLERELGRKFVKMYVSALTRDMGDSGEAALRALFTMAERAGVVSEAPDFELIR